jgi:putative flippase GtrA
MPRSLRARFRRFLVVGAVGFLADAGLLAALLAAGSGPFAARAASLAAAVLLTWRLNRRVFGPGGEGAAHELGRYLAVVAASAGVNAAVYVLVLTLAPGAPPLLALAAGSVAALGVSFAGCDRFAFRPVDGRMALTPRA